MATLAQVTLLAMRNDDITSQLNNSNKYKLFKKSWRSFSPITVCILAQCQCVTNRRALGALSPQREEAVSVLKHFLAHYMILRVYTVIVLGGAVAHL